MRKLIRLLITLKLFLWMGVLFGQPKLQTASLGDFKLESGKVIEDCKITYRTFGKLNREKSNAILFPTWFAGKSEHLAAYINPGKFVDDEKYFVIAVDALGNGNSSSPSNSEKQPGKAFPKFTIRDMVDSQYQLLIKKLKIKHLFGIIGGSMGGMQVFEWIVAYPNFMDKAISYVGSPKLTSYDLLLWNTELLAIEEGQIFGLPDRSILQIVASLQTLVLTTPHYRVRNTERIGFQDFLVDTFTKYEKLFIADDWASQIRAMMAHDVTESYFGYLEGAAEQVKCEVFVIVSKQDHIVNPEPALEFARLLNARTLILDNDCGHLAVGCDLENVCKAMQDFWESP